MIYQYGGMVHAPHFVHIMLLLGLAMVGIYGYVFFGCYVPFNLHVDKERWKEAGETLGKIRKLVGLNLVPSPPREKSAGYHTMPRLRTDSSYA